MLLCTCQHHAEAQSIPQLCQHQTWLPVPPPHLGPLASAPVAAASVSSTDLRENVRSKSCTSFYVLCFNPRPARGRQEPVRITAPEPSFNPRPRKGRPEILSLLFVSIHTPAWGRPVPAANPENKDCFNPRPCKERPYHFRFSTPNSHNPSHHHRLTPIHTPSTKPPAAASILHCADQPQIRRTPTP